MKMEKIKINSIPAIIWGKKSSKVFIAVHANMSNKEDTVIQIPKGTERFGTSNLKLLPFSAIHFSKIKKRLKKIK